MPRKAQIINLPTDIRRELLRISASRSEEARRVLRAKIILGCADGIPVSTLSKSLGISSNTVIACRKRFEDVAIVALDDRPRSGKPQKYTKKDEDLILAKLNETPPDGMSCWDGGAIAKATGISDDAVWRFLRKNNISLKRQRSWCVSTDPEFVAKAADIVALYLDSPNNAVVISIDEKPSIQALSRTTGYITTRDGKTMRAYKSTYRRNGTLNLFAALNVATGSVKGKVTERKTREDFLKFMDDLLAEYPANQDQTFHVILDNYCTHKKNNEWLAAHPNVRFHFTPTSASWLNQIEIWFGILSRKVLRGASHDSKEQLRLAIEAFLAAYNQNSKPFVWRKREVKGSQISNKIKNLCN